MRRDLPGVAGSILFLLTGTLALVYSGDFSALGAVFPRTVAAVMIVLSAVYVAVALRRPRTQAPHARGSASRRISLMAAMLLWAVLLDRIGFLTSSVAAFAALLVIANYDRWTPRKAVIYAAVGIAIIGGLYAIFRFGLQVPLPPGMLI